MEWYVLAIVTFGALFALLAIGLPIGFALMLTAAAGIYFMVGAKGLSMMPTIAFTWTTYFALIALPLFILMAEILTVTGLGADTFTAANKWTGSLPGGLCLASVVGCGMFAAVCGSSAATSAAIGDLALPEMLKRQYNKSLATGALAAGGTLGILIPPSGPAIVYGAIADQSIGRLFIAGVVPGIIMLIIFCLYVVVRALLNPSLTPRAPRVSWKEKMRSLTGIWGVGVIFVFIFGSIYSGIATPTEVAGVAATTALLLAAARRRLTLGNLQKALLKSMKLSCFIFFIVTGAMMLAYFLSIAGVSKSLTAAIVSAGMPPLVVLLVMNVVLLFLGCFLDLAAMMVITVPLFFPIIVGLGYDPIWFGIMYMLQGEMANITPPVGINVFVIKSICPPDVSMGTIFRGIYPFVGLLIIGLVLLIAFPQIALWLPSTMIK